MPVPVVRVHCRDPIYSPFSGEPVVSKEGPNRKDSTLLFIYYGDSGIYAHVSERLKYALHEDIQYLDAESLHNSIDIDGAFVMEVETDVNGINYYGFAPPE